MNTKSYITRTRLRSPRPGLPPIAVLGTFIGDIDVARDSNFSIFALSVSSGVLAIVVVVAVIVIVFCFPATICCSSTSVLLLLLLLLCT